MGLYPNLPFYPLPATIDLTTLKVVNNQVSHTFKVWDTCVFRAIRFDN
jgi:hypothetical protein